MIDGCEYADNACRYDGRFSLPSLHIIIGGQNHVAKEENRKKHTYEVCERSGDIKPCETFDGVRLSEWEESFFIPTDVKVVCCGRVNDSELLFRTENGGCYFSICDGWGQEESIMYGLRWGIFYGFRHPTAEDTIITECEGNKGTYHTWGSAMLYHSRKHTLDTIVSVIQRNGQ